MKYVVRVTSQSIFVQSQPDYEKYIVLYFSELFDVTPREAQSLVRNFLYSIALSFEEKWGVKSQHLSRPTLIKMFLWDAKKSSKIPECSSLLFVEDYKRRQNKPQRSPL